MISNRGIGASLDACRLSAQKFGSAPEPTINSFIRIILYFINFINFFSVHFFNLINQFVVELFLIFSSFFFVLPCKIVGVIPQRSVHKPLPVVSAQMNRRMITFHSRRFLMQCNRKKDHCGDHASDAD